MLTVEPFFSRSHLFGQLRSIIDMSTSRTKDMPRQQTSDGNVGVSPKIQASRASGRRRRNRIMRPEPGSLYDIMRDHVGTSLFVLPICWTDLHANLLGAHFVEQDPILKPVPGPRLCGWNSPPPSQAAQTLSRELTTLLSAQATRPYCKTRAIKSILTRLYPATFSRPKTSAELDLYFGPRVFRKAIRLPVIWKHPESAGASFDSAITRLATSFDTNLPSSCTTSPSNTPGQSPSPFLAYIGRSQLAAIRQNLFRICPGPEGGDRYNTPVLRLQQLRSRILTPANTDHDPHFVAILLAMAQASFYNEPSSKSSSQSSSRCGTGGRPIDTPPESFHDVKVQLLTHADDTADFIVYTAVVSATFLERFAQPSKAPQVAGDEPVEAGMKISFTRVPVWPVLGLKERLGKALGRDIAGDAIFEDVGPDDIETWESQEERQQREQQRKRRRGDRQVLVEVLNSSFEAEDDTGYASDDRPVLSPDAKRRCTRAVNPLEVC